MGMDLKNRLLLWQRQCEEVVTTLLHEPVDELCSHERGVQDRLLEYFSLLSARLKAESGQNLGMPALFQDKAVNAKTYLEALCFDVLNTIDDDGGDEAFLDDEADAAILKAVEKRLENNEILDDGNLDFDALAQGLKRGSFLLRKQLIGEFLHIVVQPEDKVLPDLSQIRTLRM